jgi:hypothetical protein
VPARPAGRGTSERRVKHWEVKKVKLYEVNFVVSKEVDQRLYCASSESILILLTLEGLQ